MKRMLFKIFNGYENTDPNYCYIDSKYRVYYHTKEPNICEYCDTQLKMTTDYMVFCEKCDL